MLSQVWVERSKRTTSEEQSKIKQKKSEQNNPQEPQTVITSTGGYPATDNEQQRNSSKRFIEYCKRIIWPFERHPATVSAFAAFVSALGTLAIVYLTIQYVDYSAKQWHVAQTTLEISQRAYVTIGTKDGVIGKFISSEDPRQNTVLVLYFQNSGRVPAKVAWGIRIGFLGIPTGAPQNQSSGIRYYSATGFLPSRTRDNKTGAISEHAWPNQQIATIAGESIYVAPVGEISAQELADLKKKDILPFALGNYQYCDELGTEVTHTFGLSYQNAPEPLSIKLTENAGISFPRAPSTEDMDYLSPCETVNERLETKEKVEQYNSKWKKVLRWVRSKTRPVTAP
jgi:hypothetical protein